MAEYNFLNDEPYHTSAGINSWVDRTAMFKSIKSF